ncbi:MAG: c-type cytochrome [Bacteroidales bacterium]
MKKIARIIGIIVLILMIAIVCFVGYIKFFLPDISTPEGLKVDMSPANVEKGKYLANELMGCVGCHAKRDYTKFAGPIISESKGSGGEFWGENLGFPGSLFAPNITQGSLYNWTDGEIFRAIVNGVDKEGNALFPIMPYHQYGKLPKEDIYAVIAYIKTLEPKPEEYPERELNFPLNLIVNTMPQKATHHLKPDANDLVKHGEYIITAAVCFDCHTPMEKGRFIEEMAYAGGAEFKFESGGIVRSANLTPDKETGIGNWTKKQFVQRFKAYADSNFIFEKLWPPAILILICPGNIMPTFKERDLEAIYAYLMSLDPIKIR